MTAYEVARAHVRTLDDAAVYRFINGDETIFRLAAIHEINARRMRDRYAVAA